MYANQKMTNKTKREIMIAVLLVVCFLLSIAVVILVEDTIGEPVFYDGEMRNLVVDITEVCSSNRSIIADDKGEYHDYIEFYNRGETFNLNGFGLANDTGNGVAYTFGNVEFKSGSYLVVFFDGINVPFRLSSDGGEYVSLVAYDGTVVASITTQATAPNEVMLLKKGDYELSTEASPGYENSEEGVRQFLEGSFDGNMSLVINEIFTANQSVLPDYEGEFCDIIELKNISSSIISTKGYYVSDSVEEKSKCALPEKELAPGDIVLVYASGKDTLTKSGEFHSNFRLSKDESAVIAFGSKYYAEKVISTASNNSISRVTTDGKTEYKELYATPGYENDDAGKEAIEAIRINDKAPIVINEILLSSDGVPYKGKLRDVIEICNVSDTDVSTKGYYVSDSEDDPYRYAIPEKTLKAGECMVLYAENGEGANVCGFALSSGEALYLTHPDFRRSESVPCSKNGSGKSRIRIVENNNSAYVSGDISIGFANSDSGKVSYESSVRPVGVEISEIVASNTKHFAGPYGTYHDFVELHNRGNSEIDLTGYYLSDDPEEPRKGSLDGLKIPAGGYVTVILSTEGTNIPKGHISVPFALAAAGETVTLSKGDEIIDSAAFQSLGTNTSFGRPDGSDGFYVLSSVTPNSKNSAKAPKSAVAPTSTLPQGVYKKDSVTVELKGEGAIYYTLDCTEPTAASKLYTGPITLNSTSVIRCISVPNGKPSSKVASFSYIINEPDTLETISIVTNPDNLWNYYTGIYETGPNANAAFPYEGANYYKRWEKEVTLSFFDKNGGGFSETCGVRIFGGLSRALPKKSFAFFFRNTYGAGALNYQLFEDDSLNCFESFVLRNTGQDFSYTSMRDAMISNVASDKLGIDIQKNRPVVVYLNGEYWGLYFIREKLTENYVAGRYNIDASKVEVTVANGRTSESYTALVNYASSHDLKIKEHYDYVASQMDIENYIDYSVAEMVICNTDNGNIRFFTYEGGKWRWIMYDVDHAFRTASYNTVSEHLNPAGTGGGDNFSTRLINALLKNPEFKKKYLEEIAYQLYNVWDSETVDPYIDRYVALIENDIERDRIRWDKSYENWKNSVKSLYSFTKNREAYVEKYVQSYFSLSDNEMRSYGFKI